MTSFWGQPPNPLDPNAAPFIPVAVGPGIPVFSQNIGTESRFKGIVAKDASIVIEDGGEAGGVKFSVPGGSASTNFDIPFLGHGGGADNFHYQAPRNSASIFHNAEDLSNVTITTPWPIDATELKARIDITLKGRMGVVGIISEGYKLIYIEGSLHLDREGNQWIDATPCFKGRLSSGVKFQVGTIGGFLAIQISFYNGASARELTSIVSGLSFSAANNNQGLNYIFNAGALTGPTDVIGASGLRALVVAGQTSAIQNPFFESRGDNLYLFGDISNSGGWVTGTPLFTIPAPFAPARGNFSIDVPTVSNTGAETAARFSFAGALNGGVVSRWPGLTISRIIMSGSPAIDVWSF